MNIKGIIGNLNPISLVRTNMRKTKTAGDRDPQQNQQGGGEPEKRHTLTNPEIDEALKKLKDLPGVKENNLQFRVEQHANHVIIFVEDPTGKVVSRLTDQTLWTLLKKENGVSRGHLLNKSM